LPTITIQIRVENIWPSTDDFRDRTGVTEELDAAEIGKFVGVGGGMGATDYQNDVADMESAKRQISAVLQKHAPRRNCSVCVSE